jgi:outer membrane protein TolC
MRTLITSLIAFLVSAATYAQTTDADLRALRERIETGEITLQECQALATRHNRGLQRARNSVASAISGEAMAESEVFSPELSVSQTFDEDNDFNDTRISADYQSKLGVEVEAYLSADSNNAATEPRTSTAGVTLRRRLFSAHERWRLRMPLTRAERQLLSAANTLQQRRRELDFEVMRAFLAVQRVQNRLKVRRDRVTDAEAFLTITEERVDNGLAPEVDIVNSKINLNQAEADVLNEETSLRSRTESLLNIIGMSVTGELTIEPYALASAESATFDLESDSASLRLRHESLVNTRLSIALSQIEKNIQKDRLRPRFDLALTAEQNTVGEDFFSERDDSANGVRLALTYTTTLDGKKRDKARLEQLELDLQDQYSTLIDQEHGLLLRLRAAHRSIDRLRTRVDLDKQRLEAERAKLAATIVRYEDGNVDNLEVTRAKQAVDNAEINLIDTNIDLTLAQEEYRSLLPPKKDVKTTLDPP